MQRTTRHHLHAPTSPALLGEPPDSLEGSVGARDGLLCELSGLAATPIGSRDTQMGTYPATESGHWLRNLWPPATQYSRSRFDPMESTLADSSGGGHSLT